MAASEKTKLDDKQFARIAQAVAEGSASGEPVDGETELKRLRTKYVAMAKGKSR